MKTEFELSLDWNGRPCIKFKSYKKVNDLEQKTLRLFIEQINAKGCIIDRTSEYSANGNRDPYSNWTSYEIRIKD